MSFFNYFFVCLLVLYQFQLGQSRAVDTPMVDNDKGSQKVNRTVIPSRMRIVGGDYATPGEIEYVIVTLHDDEYYMCGGGIINDYYVLSAAHCFINDQNKFGDKKITVVAGVTDYNKKPDPNRVEAEVEKVYIPIGYNTLAYPNDIALLKLKQSLNIEKNHLEKLSLPTKAHDVANRKAVMAGFGYDSRSFLTSKYSTTGRLRKADIEMFDNSECQEHYKNDSIYDSYLCGKMLKKSQWKEYGVCNGDSGSPLVLESNGTKVVVGVVSWSYGCDEREDPLVYTRVTSFLDFIRNVMKGKTNGMRIKTFK